MGAAMFLYNTIKNGLAHYSGRHTFLGWEAVIDFDRDMNFLNEQMRVYAGINRTRHNIFADNWTGETREMRLAYRKALAEPTVKACLLEKIISVCRLNLQMTPADKKNLRDHEVADFCRHSIQRSEGGTAAVLWDILSGGTVDGWSICEKVWKTEERGKYRGFRTLYKCKAKDSRYIPVEIDQYRNIVGYYSIRGNQARRFDPSGFIHFSYLSFFENPTGMSDLRASFRAIEIIPAIIKMRAIYLEKFTGPFLKGKLSNTAIREKMAEQLAISRAKGYIVLDKDSDVEVLDLSTRGTADFQAALEDLRQEIAISISGAFLHMMTGTTPDARGDSTVQQGTVDSFVWWLAELAAGAIQTYLIPDLVDHNYGSQTDLPTCSLAATNPKDVVADLQIDQLLNSMGLDLDKEDIYDRARRSPPKNPGTTLYGRAADAAPSMPGALQDLPALPMGNAT